MDKYIRVKNCNCISDATIEIVEKSLNIKYGSNGTGKSTISEAIYAQANNETDRLKDFKPYGSNDNSQPTVDNPYFHVVKVFNEDYVNSYLFQGDEFLDDSFQVFLKSDKCDSLAAQIERMLRLLFERVEGTLSLLRKKYPAACKFVNETNHVENDYIYQLDPRKYFGIPNYYLQQIENFIQENKETILAGNILTENTELDQIGDKGKIISFAESTTNKYNIAKKYVEICLKKNPTHVLGEEIAKLLDLESI